MRVTFAILTASALFAPWAAAQGGPPAPSGPAPSGTAPPGTPADAPPSTAPYPPPSAPTASPSTAPAQPPPPGYPPGYGPAPGTPATAPGYPTQPPPAYGPYPAPPPAGYGPVPYDAPQTRRHPSSQYSDTASTESSPFLDLLIAGVAEDKRFDHLFNVGIQAGAYLGGRVRIAGRFIMLTSEPDDDLADESRSSDTSDLPAGYIGVSSEPPIVVYGGSLGFAVVAKRNFALAPGVLVMRTDESDYGTFLGMGVPFEWVGDDGARFGFEVGFGRGFGGEIRGRCVRSPCTVDQEKTFDRPTGGVFYAHFQFGWGFNHPEPISRGTP